ncbi:hypothetical protein D3Z55_01455 [Clostridiaceae bacterium]|jgi:hypothetical protein|nr:hypothetical protein [Clostridiaceae bacterium]
MEKKQKDKKRRIKFKQVLLWGLVGCTCFFAGRLTRYGITELKYAYILYHHEKLLPLWEVYYPYEPVWAGKEYSFRNDYHITYMYEDGREQFERLEEYIKTRNEYMSYNICYRYESEENEGNGKLYKRIYEKADSGNLQEADWKEELEEEEKEILENFCRYLIDDNFVTDPQKPVEVMVSQVEGEEEPLILIEFLPAEGKTNILTASVFHHPCLPKAQRKLLYVELEDIEFTSEGERLVELGDSWYFRQEICRRKYAETE